MDLYTCFSSFLFSFGAIFLVFLSALQNGSLNLLFKINETKSFTQYFQKKKKKKFSISKEQVQNSAKRFPIKLENKVSAIYKESKTLYIYLETSWEKESWSKRLASCEDKKQLEWFPKLQKDFQGYLISLNAGYPSFMKPSVGFYGAEPVDRSQRIHGSSKRTLSDMRTPSYIGDVICTDLDPGNVPPYIHGMRVLPVEMNKVLALEVDIEYSGGAVLGIETRLEVRELDPEKRVMNSKSASSFVEDVPLDLLEGFEYLGKQLNLVEGTTDALEHKEEGDQILDFIDVMFFKDNVDFGEGATFE
ncbi:hypothetical protein UlMin_031927, partial [Ulmus minor]